jgi:hypothetical protein
LYRSNVLVPKWYIASYDASRENYGYGNSVEIFFVDAVAFVYYFVPYMNKEVTKKEPKWSKVNIKTSLLKDLQATALKACQSVPSIVGEAAEIWLRDVAPKRISLIAKSYSPGDIIE